MDSNIVDLNWSVTEWLNDAECQDDDWTGLRDRAERRKRQTRLAVRAHRRRKALATRTQEENAHHSLMLPSSYQSDFSRRRRTSGDKAQTKSLRVIEWKPKDKRQDQNKPTHESCCLTAKATLINANGCCTLPLSMIELIARFSQPCPSPPVPASVRDLFPIVQFNLLRAALTNAVTLSLHHMIRNCNSIISHIELFPTPGHVPATLKPTSLQDEIPHDSCIDLIPSATMRNNAIRYASKFSQTRLIRDILERDITPNGEPMLIAWTDPWDPNGWEITEAFLSRYGFLVEGCTDMMIATNRWRALRGEEPIVWEVTRTVPQT